METLLISFYWASNMELQEKIMQLIYRLFNFKREYFNCLKKIQLAFTMKQKQVSTFM